MKFNLRTKLSFSFLLIATLVAVVSWSAFISIDKIRTIFHEDVFKEIKAVELLQEMLNVADKVRIQTTGFQLLTSETAQSEGTKTADQKYELLANMEILDELELTYSKATEHEEERHEESITDIGSTKDRLLSAALAVIEAKERNILSAEQFSTLVENLESTQGSLEAILNAALEDEREDLDTHTQTADTYADQARNISIIGSTAAVILSLIIGFITSNLISKPISRMRNAATQIASGNLSQRIIIHSKDEIGELASAFNNMTDKLAASNADLAGKISELERMNTLMIGRELKMIELKKEIERTKTK